MKTKFCQDRLASVISMGNPSFPADFPSSPLGRHPPTTCFADTVSALAALPLEKQEKLKNLEWEDPGLGFIWIFFL